MKKQNGITLIALIITIVLLLIIAVVTIGQMKDSKIIDHAQSASDSYVVEQEKERIALAYSEYQIEKILDPSKTLQISGEDATTEPVGNNGWKVKYENTGNIYGVNTKGEYDEAITMIVKAVDEVSEIFDEFKKTNSELDIDGISLEDFIIYEDTKAISENTAAGSILYPEKYVFYNWNKLTTDEIRVIETQYEPTTGTNKKIENATNRLFILDINGDSYVNETDEDMIKFATASPINSEKFINNIGVYPMEQRKNNHIINLCVTEEIDEKEGKNITVYDQMVNGKSDLSQYYCNFNEETDFYDRRCNILMKFSHPDSVNAYVRAVNSADRTTYRAYEYMATLFCELYDSHIYYTSGRPSSI